MRARLHQAAVDAARAVGYVNAGTVEFLLEGDAENARFYFLEVNTRLQVEHPVTEAVTGLDLVRAQLEIAAGAPLPFTQADIAARGHAVECRVYAEDSRRLLPQTGRLVRYREPHGPGLRTDSGVVEGQAITVHYDPLIAKLIAHADTRDDAIELANAALGRYEILGVRHNIAFLRRLLSRQELRSASLHTQFIETHHDELTAAAPVEIQRAAAAVAAFTESGLARTATRPGTPRDTHAAVTADDPWGPGPAESAADPWASLGSVTW